MNYDCETHQNMPCPYIELLDICYTQISLILALFLPHLGSIHPEPVSSCPYTLHIGASVLNL